MSTYCITNDLTDYVETPTPIQHKVQGISKQEAEVTYFGKANYKILDDQGRTHEWIIPKMYYCATLPIRIISPQHMDNMWRKDKIGEVQATTNHNSTIISWKYYKDETQYTKIILHEKKSSVPVFTTAPSNDTYNHSITRNNEYCTLATIPEIRTEDMVVNYTATIETSNNINEDENIFRKTPINIDFHDNENKKINNITVKNNNDLFLYWHHKLGHMPFNAMKLLSQNGMLPKIFTKLQNPKCTSCYFGRATKRPWRNKSNYNNIARMHVSTKPGSCVSVDQMQSPVPGLIAQMKGIPTRDRYNCATVFVDHFSDISFLHLQRNTSAKETLEAKEAFEKWSATHNVKIKHYHADNGRFADNAFMQDVAMKGQTISFCGVNAHFQNGKAERKIRTIQEFGRTQLLDAQNKWPAAITTNLWPYAIKNVNDILNDSIRKDETRTRIEMFTNVDIRPNIRNYHHFGTPTYVLNNELQANIKINKWLPRTRIGIYLCKSPRHASTVSLILNPRTGMVSPQFHAHYDDTFGTVQSTRDEQHSTWIHKCGFQDIQHTTNSKFLQHENLKTQPKVNNTNYNQITEDAEEQTLSIYNSNKRDITQISTDESNITIEGDMPTNEGADMQGANTNLHQVHTTKKRRWKPTTKMLESIQQQDLTLTAIDSSISNTTTYNDKWNESLHYDPYEICQTDDINPISLMAKVEADTMYWHQAMAASDHAQFMEAAKKEIQSHEDNKHWKLVKLEDIPKGTKILDSIWSMKRKRRLATNEIYKWKARLNIHGGQQEYGVNYWETYAPVVTWASIRLILTLSLLHNWHTRQIDFVMAYPQAEVECDLYMKIPRGFEIPNEDSGKYALKLLKNLYGQKQAGRVWNKHLHNNLIKLGWIQSKSDECVYFKNGVIFCVYVDDGILASEKLQNLETVIKELQQIFKLTVEGTINDYAGVHINRHDDGTIHMTQPQMVQSILKELNFDENTKSAKVPTQSTKIITSGKELPLHNADWHYRRLIGKLNFLEKSCRPEIACAVHECARYMETPHLNHTEAIKRIARYLKGTVDQGIILNPQHHSFEVWADAAFGSLWNKDLAMDEPSSAKSRTGYVIQYAGCPLIWASQLQTEIAQSTTESEYIALSTSLRQTIPLMNLLKEIKTQLNIEVQTIPTIHCTLFEDNTGAIELSKVPKMRPRTRHINVKYHHFRKYVFDGLITIEQVDTEDQIADLLTKHVPEYKFLKFRKAICGW